MGTLKLTAQQDHLEKVARTSDPIKAISEFIWNGLDANATEISIDLALNPLGGIQTITVSDNGTGISKRRAEEDFANLGDSWKKSARTTIGKRALHGKEGRGRLRFFSLANAAIWKSTYRENDQLTDIEIRIDAASLGKCEVSDPARSTNPSTGTRVELINLKSPLDWLASKAAFLELSAVFAPYLLRYPNVEINYNGTRIRPSDAIYLSTELPRDIVICPSRTITDLSITVVEWNSHVEARRIHLGGENGIVLGSQPANVTAPGFEYSAYAYSTFFQEIADANLLEIDSLTDPDFAKILIYVRDQLTDYFRKRQADNSRGLIDKLKTEGAYPYVGEPRDEIERKERQVFDIATYAVSSYSREFGRADTSLKKMTLTLLKEAVRHNPDSLSTILRAVVNLPKARQDEFSSLLEKTGLGNIISASSLIADRVVALEILREIAFNPEHRERVRERGELDVIVRDNTWIFGEQFHITLAESGLTKVMERVAQDLAAKTSRKVRKPNGAIGRLDNFLGRVIPQPDSNKREYLVIELKRPSISVGRKELDQLEDYVSAIKSQPDYLHTDTFWSFFLITGEYHPTIKDRITQKERPPGLFLDSPNSQVWVKTWSELIRECESRLSFIQEKLRVEISAEEINAKILALRSSVLKERTDEKRPSSNTKPSPRGKGLPGEESPPAP
ncbi:ATP-binding protein [Rhodopseudomonas sp. NSM]|uniref:ATP-binding protein n=1 Tax=Rhodopseudomonas sp. NSM TaxID=3457630 RepID=UPI0040363D7A